MAKSAQMVQVGPRQVELTNLSKVLFPDDGIIKAEIIEYYLKIAPTLLRHIKGRALSLVRYPDGIYGESFFQKNRPDWAPDWVEYVTIGDEEKSLDYMLATEEATLVWLANLACIEMHQIHSRTPNIDKPDYMVFDIDPPEGFNFRDVVEIALDLRAHVDSFGYTTFAKTSGKKGIHVVAPIEPEWPFSRVFEDISAIAKPFVQQHSSRLTLKISKNARQGKVLVDIYRNRATQSIVSAYSLRAAAGAPVSMPIHWDDLERLEDPSDFNLHTVLPHILTNGDAWEGIRAFAVPIHTERPTVVDARTVPESRTYKSPAQLDEYAKKRSFGKTPEPAPYVPDAEGKSFVVHRHHASRLHYDLRLEQDGILKSWAVPRGLPPRPGIKRLALSVEDHPVEYLTFEGRIPKGEYGAGPMWVFALGKYEILKQKKDGFYFRLQSPQLTADYRIYHTRDNEWLCERLDQPQFDWPAEIIDPMLADASRNLPKSGDWIYEMKWDGIRAIISIDEGELRIHSRNRNDITHLFPELNVPEAFFSGSAVLDGEIVCLDPDGRPNFRNVVRRLHHNSEATIQKASRKHPAFCYLFDCLYLDGRGVTQEPMLRRRDWLADTVKRDTPYRVSEIVEDGAAFFEAVKAMGLEGVIAKDPAGKYSPGRRSPVWRKVKVRNTADCVIIGYTQGKGDRQSLFGALQIAEVDEGSLQYRGKVGTGFDTAMMKAILAELSDVPTAERPVDTKPPDDKETTWIEPRLWCEVQFASITKNKTYREPVFVRMRPDIG
ncbi:MAG: non-homologous end-joining DNA ligase [Bacteroidetes bacterium]|nr:non-homologous end-joining DNA ligase [Bacteroidota bacterium]